MDNVQNCDSHKCHKPLDCINLLGLWRRRNVSCEVQKTYRDELSFK
jgi:hypothetical protein